MEIDLWEGTNKVGQRMPESGRHITKWVPMLELTTVRINPRQEAGKDGGIKKKEHQGEASEQNITIHHPNLSKLLERRQSLRDSTSSIENFTKGGKQRQMTVGYNLPRVKGLDELEEGKNKE